MNISARQLAAAATILGLVLATGCIAGFTQPAPSKSQLELFPSLEQSSGDIFGGKMDEGLFGGKAAESGALFGDEATGASAVTEQTPTAIATETMPASGEFVANF